MGIIKREELPPIFDCGICGISWDSKEEYEQHCKDDPLNHTQEGEAPCIFCGKICHFPNMIFTKEKEPTPAVCDNCQKLILLPSLKAQGVLPKDVELTETTAKVSTTIKGDKQK